MLEKSIGSVSHRFIGRTGGARLAIVFNEGLKSGPVVLPSDCVKCLHLANGLQGDDRASIGEHVVEDCLSQGHICVLYAEVDHRRFGSRFGLTEYRGVRKKRGRLVDWT